MTGSESAQEPGGDDESAALVAAFRHDVHKLRGKQHASADREVCGVAVNQSVPGGADGDAAVLSRPSGEPEETVANHVSPARLSLVTGAAVADPGEVPASVAAVRGLVRPGCSDPVRLHAEWLTSDVAAWFNESVYVPYTSLKHHTLLVAALLDNYRAGHAFEDLCLVAERPARGPPTGDDGRVAAALDAEVVVPCRTVLWTSELAVRVTGDAPSTGAVASLGAGPARSFADTWSRLSAQPLDVERKWLRVVDAQLRRIRSFSTALQYVEDVVEGDVGAAVRGGVGVIRAGGRGRRVGAVVGRRRGRGSGLRVVVGSQPRRVRAAGRGLGAGLFVVGRRGAGARLGNRWCGSQLGVPLRPCHRDSVRTLETRCADRVTGRRRTLETGCVDRGESTSWRTLETGCAVRGADSVVCECVTISSGSAGVVA